MQREHQAGITLLQAALLLLFVGIIVVMIFPFFEEHGDRPREGTCLSNQKRLGLSILQYYQDYDEYFPVGTQASVVRGRSQHKGVGWAGQVFGYAKSTLLFTCPQDHTLSLNKRAVVISYAFNANITRDGSGLASFTSPNKTVILFEVANAHADIQDYDEGASLGATAFSPVGDGTAMFLDGGRQTPGIVYATGGGGKRPYASGPWPPNRHIDANYLLSDGHIKWYRPAQVSTGENARHPKDSQTGSFSGHAAGTANDAYAATFSTK